jgi:hypothetical protein
LTRPGTKEYSRLVHLQHLPPDVDVLCGSFLLDHDVDVNEDSDSNNHYTLVLERTRLNGVTTVHDDGTDNNDDGTDAGSSSCRASRSLLCSQKVWRRERVEHWLSMFEDAINNGVKVKVKEWSVSKQDQHYAKTKFVEQLLQETMRMQQDQNDTATADDHDGPRRHIRELDEMRLVMEQLRTVHNHNSHATRMAASLGDSLHSVRQKLTTTQKATAMTANSIIKKEVASSTSAMAQVPETHHTTGATPLITPSSLSLSYPYDDDHEHNDTGTSAGESSLLALQEKYSLEMDDIVHKLMLQERKRTDESKRGV